MVLTPSNLALRMPTRTSGRLLAAFSVGLLLLAGPTTLAAGPAGCLTIGPSKTAVPVTVALPAGVTLEQTRQLIEGNGKNAVPVQLVREIAADGSAGRDKGRLVSIVAPCDGATGQRCFQAKSDAAASCIAGAGFQFKDVNDKSLGLWEGDKPVFVYNHGVITNDKVPQKDTRRSRACYVHPVWGLNAEVVTDDFPKDHYHHHGIFWTWPHVGIDGQHYDLWADQGGIRQQFVRWLDRETGPLAAVLGVENGWFVGHRKVMIERVWLQAYQSDGQTRALDIELVFIPVDRPVTLWGAEGKSYGGLTTRFAPRSRRDTLITVPTGRTEDDLPDTPLAWADFTSRFGDMAAQSGGAIFVAPEHPDYPPTWLTRHYGAMCVGWPGIHPKTFEPGKPIRLCYRVWLHKTAVDPATLQAAYDAYCVARAAKWEQRKTD